MNTESQKKEKVIDSGVSPSLNSDKKSNPAVSIGHLVNQGANSIFTMSIELTSKEIKASKPINAMQLDIPKERKIIHKQIIIVPKRAQFEIEFSWTKTKFFIVIKRRLDN